MTTKKLINGVNATKANANAKANASVSLVSLFKETNEKTQGLLKTSLGQKTEIYKKELFEGMNAKQIKSSRKKIRNYVYNLLSNIAESKNEKLIAAFLDFYKNAYAVNDFSFSSIASENTKDEKKEVLKKGLEIVKTSLKK